VAQALDFGASSSRRTKTGPIDNARSRKAETASGSGGAPPHGPRWDRLYDPPMSMDRQQFAAADGTLIDHARWLPGGSPRAVLQVVHGAAEHAGRYDRFARAAVARGHAVYATDHRGHGRTRLRSGRLGDAGPDAWNRMVGDEIALAQRLRAAHPGVPIVLLGHSLGSFIAQDLITRAADRQPPLLDALVLSGTSYREPPPAEAIRALDEAARREPLGDSALWASRFADYNKPFGGPTGFEWLSRDAAEVQRYVSDPLCGFAFTHSLVRDIFVGFAQMRDPAREARIPTGLPVLVIQGELDPVGENLAGTRRLVERYRALGLTRVETRYYTGARHELLNESNRDEVTADVLDWVARVVGG
jgi:alpha-beta hydrolase superfamily lysophospholipase